MHPKYGELKEISKELFYKSIFIKKLDIIPNCLGGWKSVEQKVVTEWKLRYGNLVGVSIEDISTPYPHVEKYYLKESLIAG